MAKQVGIIKLKGSIDGLTFYELNGEFYCKRKPTFSKHKYKNHQAYAMVRKNASIFGQASKLASKIYRNYSKQERLYGAFQKLTSEVYKRLNNGEEAKSIQDSLSQIRLIPNKQKPNNDRMQKKSKHLVIYLNKKDLFNSQYTIPIQNALMEAINKLGIAI